MNDTNISGVLDLLIIGGGLSGLTIANELQAIIEGHEKCCDTNNDYANSSNFKWNLFEARSVLGGRLANDGSGHQIDLGGAWIWPNRQPRIRQMVKKFKLSTFPQFDDPSSTRIDGGAVGLIHALSLSLPPENIRLDSPITKITLLREGNEKEQLMKVETRQGDSDISFLVRRIAIAAPPKIVSNLIQFDPPLSEEKQEAMKESHTWMAGVTKVSLVYPSRFWTKDMSNMGLPQTGRGLYPAFQVYDASTKDGSIAALTFFALESSSFDAASAADIDKQLADDIASQIASVWRAMMIRQSSSNSVSTSGNQQQLHEEISSAQEQVRKFDNYHVKRWPMERYISEDQSPKVIHPHPYPVRNLSTNDWNGRLLFAGTETDLSSPGVLEGAVGAADRVLRELRTSFRK